MIVCTSNPCIPAVGKPEQGQRDTTLITATNLTLPHPIIFILFFILFAAEQSQIS
ncbi:MAG TPA: hypothetical protein VHR15_03780 [Ktedonobacterales bacterium]|jgi:hypothetical protein|nr:hypothetical protein [Ktedonobacterales bacterium]